MKLLLGGSPCTHWSIAQTKNRETKPEGLGWELFKNYLIALEKFKPDYFLYENNKSMSPAIRAQITKELGVEPILINSALVSAQNRQRLYWTNIPGVEQPKDKGILLRDILESGLPLKEKGYALAEPVNITTDGKAQCLRATYYKDGIRNMVGNTIDRKTCVAEPVRIGTIESKAKNADFDSQQYRVYSPDGKSVTLCGQGGGVGAKTGLYATPVRVGDMPNAEGHICGSQSKRIYSVDGKAKTICASGSGGNSDMSSPATGLYAVPYDCDVIITENSIRCQRRDKKHSTVQGSHVNFEDGKTQTLSPSHIPQVIEANYEIIDGAEILVANGKIRQGDDKGSKQGKYVYTELTDKSNTISAGQAHNEKVLVQAPDGTWKNIYEVRDGMITIKDKQYPIKLADGFYIIRKLTVTECKRLQTVPEDYEFSERILYKQIFHGGIDNCPNAESKVVIAKSGTVVQDYAICTTFDIQDMGQQIGQGTMLTTVKSASLKVVKERDRQTSAIVLCTTNDLGDMEQQSCLLERLQNVKFVVNQQLQEDCVLVTTQAIENTETQDVLIHAEMLLHPEDTKKGHTKITRWSTEKLRQKCLGDHLHQKILSTILTAISQIMMRITFTYAQQASTASYTINLKNVRQNYFELGILNLTVESTKPISGTQAYKMLGNGWTVDVIAHILSYCPGITAEPLEVLSMYDGMSCGHLALDKLGAHISHYYATEIDKYAIKTTQHNFPDTIQLGDAFQVREEDWHIG